MNIVLNSIPHNVTRLCMLNKCDISENTNFSLVINNPKIMLVITNDIAAIIIGTFSSHPTTFLTTVFIISS